MASRLAIHYCSAVPGPAWRSSPDSYVHATPPGGLPDSVTGYGPAHRSVSLHYSRRTVLVVVALGRPVVHDDQGSVTAVAEVMQACQGLHYCSAVTEAAWRSTPVYIYRTGYSSRRDSTQRYRTGTGTPVPVPPLQPCTVPGRRGQCTCRTGYLTVPYIYYCIPVQEPYGYLILYIIYTLVYMYGRVSRTVLYSYGTGPQAGPLCSNLARSPTSDEVGLLTMTGLGGVNVPLQTPEWVSFIHNLPNRHRPPTYSRLTQPLPTAVARGTS